MGDSSTALVVWLVVAASHVWLWWRMFSLVADVIHAVLTYRKSRSAYWAMPVEKPWLASAALRGLWCRLGLSVETVKLAGFIALAWLLRGVAVLVFDWSLHRAVSARADNGDWHFWRAAAEGWRDRMVKNERTRSMCWAAWKEHRRFLWCVRQVPLSVLPEVLEQARAAVEREVKQHG